MVKRYDNGELVKKPRMEEEPWYPDYQRLIEMATRGPVLDVEQLREVFLADYEEVMNKPYADPEQVLRWAVLQVERRGEFEHAMCGSI